MANKPLHEYNPFRGNEGFIIVDGLDNTASGGILKFPNYAGKTDGAVLTKKTVNNADEIVWEAPQGGMEFPDTLDISTWSKPDNPDYTKAIGDSTIYCHSTGLNQDGKLQLQCYWKLEPYDSAGFRGTPMSGAFN
jgi:hypothetical protein